MIWLIQQLGAGNALRVLIAPPSGATRWRLLRKDADDFTGYDDPDALLVSDGDERAVTDHAGLMNGVPVFYRVYSLINAAWVDSGETATATPDATMADLGGDILSLMRERLEDGFKVYVDRGQIANERGFVPCLLASPQVEEAPLPLVTVHLQSAAMEVRGIGELPALDVFDPDANVWLEAEGGFDRVLLMIVCWSVNSDMRIIMRKALRAILQANLPIFDAAGILTPSWSMQDMEDYQTYQVPMFQTMCTFECLVPATIETTVRPIREVETVAHAINF